MLVWFHDINAKDVNIVGGKGANLGEMTRAGFHVPPGFCVTVQAYKQHLDKSNLWPQIEQLLGDLNSEDITKLDKTAKDIRKMIEQSPMLEHLESQIKAAYAKLSKDGCPRVAIRSSATAEDLPEASFAGQHESFLSIQDANEVLKYIKKCWASLWTGRSIAYRNKNGFEHKEVSLAVVVQAMIESEKSGVLFTINPLAGQYEEMLVNAAYGLGESIVSGRVTPDIYRISKKDTPLVLERQLGSKETCIRSKHDGKTNTEEVGLADRERFCLNQSELKELQKMGLLIENHYKIPQDIEWAFADGHLYLLQTRPVTSISKEPETEFKLKKLSKIQKMEIDNFKEHLPTPPYPLEYETMLGLLEEKHRAYKALGLYIPSAERVLVIDDNGIPFINPVAPRPNFRFLRLPFNIQRLLRLNATDSSKDEELELSMKLKELRKLDLSSLNDKAIVSFIKDVLDVAVAVGRIRFSVYVFPMVLLGFWLNVLIRFSRVPYDVSHYDLLGSLDYKTALIDKALYELASLADSLPIVRKAVTELPIDKIYAELQESKEGYIFLQAMETFLKEHGSRTMKAYMPISNLSSWSEDPNILLNTLSAILRSEHANNYDARLKETGEKLESLKSDIMRKLPGFLRSSFLKRLGQFRNAFKGREFTLYAIEECYVAFRSGIKEGVNRLVNKGYIKNAEYVVYLTLTEFYKALKQEIQADSVCEIVYRRKQYRDSALAIWNSYNAEEISKSGNYFKGIPSSKGIAKGTVKVVSGPSEFGKLEKGDVLVCTFTDPAWTPLFSLVCAVISDTGGPLSHAAIVAREYSIPAVLGTKVATSKLKDGNYVTVDGSKGIIYIENN